MSPATQDKAVQNILITGAAGLVGPLLAARLLNTPQYRLLLTDIAEPIIPANAAFPHHATTLQGDITSPEFITTLVTHPSIQPLHAVFLFHGIMSAAAEANPSLSLQINVDSIRHLTTALIAHHPPHAGSVRVRVIYASSLAVFGPPFPTSSDGTGKPVVLKIPPTWAPTPQSTYGTHKLMTEVYLNELHRRGLLDVFTCRFPTIAVRPGKPTGAASSFWSGIIREPMNGMECVVPIKDRGFRGFMSSPGKVVENLVRVLGWESGLLPAHVRWVLFPGAAVSVQELRDALARYGGEERLGLIREVEDEGLGRILRSWAEDFEVGEPLRLGLVGVESGDEIVREYVQDLNK
ncbi:NAD(P)-binding protein [Parathielavia appendiculata]|uniref:NAD(P)-binding protein n=1 Tax=Parathielavia appendiculata TaxID=2587402 RepID=A0AAN6TW48_9PEZI|nr:NAD(P)-binding protein [Parathielavia appendiculata]